MADPATIAIAGMGTSAAGGILGAIGSVFSGGAQSNMYRYQAGVAQINKQIALQNADYARKAGEVEAQESGMATRFRVGEIKTAQAGKGFDVDSGSAAEVRQSQTEVGQFDEAMIRSNAARRAYGFEVEASSQEAQSRIDEYAAKTSKTAGTIGAVSSILGGASSVASKWLQGGSVFPNEGGSTRPRVGPFAY